jgi:hypothetical protein
MSPWYPALRRCGSAPRPSNSRDLPSCILGLLAHIRSFVPLGIDPPPREVKVDVAYGGPAAGGTITAGLVALYQGVTVGNLAGANTITIRGGRPARLAA